MPRKFDLHFTAILGNHSIVNAVYSRRHMIALAGKAAVAAAMIPPVSFGKEERSATNFGAVVGEPIAAKIGEKILADGGNAIDAAVATALAAGIVSPGKCGIGGYGGHAVIAKANGKVVAVDFNSTAPAAAREDMFEVDAKGKVKGNANMHGWLAAAVPGTLAGLELILTRFGTLKFSSVLEPTIQLCEEGVSLGQAKGPDDASRNEASPESFDAEKGQKQKNLALAKLLKILAERNSADSFYRGDIARTIADDFHRNGGLVTFKDLAAYRAREVEPVRMKWNGFTIYTAPLTSPGAMLVEALSILKALNWVQLSGPERLHAKIDAMRIAWADRAKYFGDPDKVRVPVDRLLSSNHIGEMADKTRLAVKIGKLLPLKIEGSNDEGTINISSVDKHGNMAAITLTHGSTLGARVSVAEYGLVLGHGMWRFEPRPGFANSVGPGKRAITNMCPTAVLRDGKPVMAVGGAGGTRIPTSVYEVLLNYVGLNTSMEAAISASRVHTTGTPILELEKSCATEDEAFLKTLGYRLTRAHSAYVSAVSFDAKTRATKGAARGGV